MRTNILNLLAPPRCVHCGRSGDPLWCTACTRLADQLNAPERAIAVHHEHPTPMAAFDGAIACFRYSGVVADAIVTGKVAGAWSVFVGLGHRLADRIRADSPLHVDVLVPVPAEPRRRRRRGFDHTALLASAAARELSIPVLTDALTVPAGTADRVGAVPADAPPAPPQILPRRSLRGAVVAIVDDVVTTGVTASSATSAALRAGATGVLVAACATSH